MKYIFEEEFAVFITLNYTLSAHVCAQAILTILTVIISNNKTGFTLFAPLKTCQHFLLVRLYADCIHPLHR